MHAHKKIFFQNYLDEEEIRMEEPRDDDYDDEDYAISNDDDDDGWNLLKIEYGAKNVTFNNVPTVHYYESPSEDETPPAPPPSPNFDNYF